MAATPLETPAAEAGLLERAARSMVTAGPTLTGAERRELAVRSRSLAEGPAATEGGGQPVPAPPPSSTDPLDELTHRLTVAPASIVAARASLLNECFF